MMDKTRQYLLLGIYMLLGLSIESKLNACTVFFGADSQHVLAGTNKSHTNLATQVAVYADQEGKYDRIYLGYHVSQGFQNVGGINEHGLWYDGADLPYRDDIKNHFFKPTMPGEIVEYILEHCKTVAEAKSIYEQYYTPHWQGHSMWGDASGKSMVTEFGDFDVEFIEPESSFQLMTNFYLLDTKNEKWMYCYRYSKAKEMLIAAEEEYTTDKFRSILDATHQVGIPPTVYSAIYDLKLRTITLFNFHDFEEAAVLSVDTLIAKGSAKYNMPELFSGITLDFPGNGDAINSDAILLEWRGDAPEYQVRVSSDSDFESVTFYSGAEINDSRTLPLAMISLFIPFGLFSVSYRKLLITRISLILFTLAIFLVSCLNPLFSPYEPSNHKHELLLENLETSTTYYWKVQSLVQDGIVNESLSRSFQVK